MDKYLIAGLGNPDAEYEHTRHNVGWDIVGLLAGAAEWRAERYANVAEVGVKGRRLTLIRPTTYMNLSGKAVRYWADRLGVDGAHTVVVVDDLALPAGAIRLKPQGSPGGHNGLKSISECLGSDIYARLRFGIGNDYPRGAQVDYVLGRWDDATRERMEQRMERAAEALKSYVCAGLEVTMNQYNGV